MLGGIARGDRQRFLPIFPIFVFEQNCDRGTDRDAMVHARENVRLVRLDLHAPAATITLLPSPKVAIEKFLIHGQTRRQTRQEGNQGFTMGLPGCEVAQHKPMILTDEPFLTRRSTWKISN